MSRIANAWRALMGEPQTVVTVEKVVERAVEKKVPVVGDAATVKLYATAIPTGAVTEGTHHQSIAVTETQYFLTCALAHKAAAEAVWPDNTIYHGYGVARGSVSEVSAILLGGEYFPMSYFGPAVPIVPKPQRAKGAK